MTSNTSQSTNEIAPHTLIVADIHLQPDPNHRINQHFLNFLETTASKSEALYILGDLFEMWVGDDVCLELYQPVVEALKKLSQNGTRIFIQYGNRDFLMRHAFWEATQAKKLNDIEQINLYGTPYLLLHGDTLCSDDTGYQRMRKVVRNKLVQFIFLALSQKQRLAIGKKMRQKSAEHSAEKQTEIMDVNNNEVASLFKHNPQIEHMIHGHTHRPAHHQIEVEGMTKNRWVLGDWRPQAKILKISAAGVNMLNF